jgi:hypothetical protein
MTGAALGMPVKVLDQRPALKEGGMRKRLIGVAWCAVVVGLLTAPRNRWVYRFNLSQVGEPIANSVRRRVNYNFQYGWRFLHDPPEAPIARLHAVVLRTAVHAVRLHLSRRD